MKRTGLSLVLGLLVLLACAKKMLPPSPDRFAPHLSEIVTPNRSQVELVFDEPMDSKDIVTDSFTATGPDGNRLELRGASLGRQPEHILLWTPIQVEGLYQVTGSARDQAGNLTRFRARFRGSVKPDTIAPRVVRLEPTAGTTRLKKLVQVRVNFSEPMDTSGRPSFLFVPARFDTLFDPKWGADWQSIQLAARDSMPDSTIIYFALKPGMKDLEGNRVRSYSLTYYTPDSAYDAAAILGRARKDTARVGPGLVFFSREELLDSVTRGVRTSGMAGLLADGSFSTRLRRGSYEVLAVADTNFDGISDFVSRPQPFSTEQESLFIELVPETLPRPIDAYRR